MTLNALLKLFRQRVALVFSPFLNLAKQHRREPVVSIVLFVRTLAGVAFRVRPVGVNAHINDD
jgi:hypothetical protein